MASKKKNTNDLGKLAKQVDECIKLVGKSAAIVGAHAPMLSTDARRSVPKSRAGSATVIATIASLGKEHGLDRSERPIDAMSLNVERAKAFEPLRAQLRVCLKMVDDAVLANSGEAWKTATLVYTMLRRLAKTNPTLAVQLAPVSAFFAHGPRANAAAKTAAQSPAKGRANAANAAASTPSPIRSGTATSPNGAAAPSASIGHA